MRDAVADAVSVGELAAEVRRLRRSAWAWRAAGLLALAWAAARPVGAVGTQAGPKRLTAEVLAIVDDKGRERMVLAAADGGPEIAMFDPGGAQRISIVAGEATGPGVSIMGPKSDGRIQMGVYSFAPNSPYLDTIDAKGNASPLLDKAGKPLAAPAVSPTGRPSASPRR